MTPAPEAWIAANQATLTAEFARVAALLSGESAEPALEEIERCRAALPMPASIDALAQAFALSGFERDLLLLVAGVEMDEAIARLCARRHDAEERDWASFGLALDSLPDPHWSALTPVRALRRWHLLEVEETARLTAARLRIDERVLQYLAGINYLDPRLRPLLRGLPRPAHLAPSQEKTAEALAARLLEDAAAPKTILLHGEDRSGCRDIASKVCERLGLGLHRLAAAEIPEPGHERALLATLWERDGLLLNSALLVEQAAETLSPHQVAFLESIEGLVFLSAKSEGEAAQLKGGQVQRHRVEKPEPAEQQALWQATLGAAGAKLNGSLEGVSAQFRLSAEQIRRTAAEIGPALQAAAEPDRSFWQACRQSQSARLGHLAQPIVSRVSWDDIVLPEAEKRALGEIAVHLRQRLKVYEDWGFGAKSRRGLGITALFAGESGTGKTLAAEILGNELGLDLFRIDLSAVISKYIGETEKNLSKIFEGAEDSGAILLFDEADALFGKRGEVKDSHDRYANIEVSYLLQRMEAYRGLAILTTNLKSSLDRAFLRRLRFVVNFPFPERGEREAIWRRVFPEATPTEGLDFAKLSRLAMAGGNIRNIALSAAFQAAEEGAAVAMRHLVVAAHGEAAKREQSLTDAETRGWTTGGRAS